jgi:hypothetical protein
MSAHERQAAVELLTIPVLAVFFVSSAGRSFRMLVCGLTLGQPTPGTIQL